LKQIRELQPDCILTIAFDDFWMASSALLGRATRTPVVFYAHDAFLDSAVGGVGRRVRSVIERECYANHTVVCLCDSLAELYEARYRLRPVVVRHPMTRPQDRLPPSPRIQNDVVGFAGAIYDNNVQQIIDLVRATAANGMRVHLWTDAHETRLRSTGILGDHVSVGFEKDRTALLTRLSECGLLYLPLAFEGTKSLPSQALQHAMPTKAVDYLIAGRPILVHAPEHFEVSRFMVGKGAGHSLTEREGVSAWLSRWRAGAIPALAQSGVSDAFTAFDAQTNAKAFESCLRSVAGRDESPVLPE
jgi:hypothetical protein